MKVYEVETIDIWNNITLIGFYKDLNDAIDDINGMIFDENFKLEKGDLKEYLSTFSYVFDTTVGDIYDAKHPNKAEDLGLYDEDDYNMQIRGFILDSDELISILKQLAKGEK